MFKYDSEEKIRDLVRSFETAEIPRDEWGHPEHLVVAAYYCSALDTGPALSRMKTGILNLLNTGFGIDLAVESPYHETLTVFWMGAVRHFLKISGNPSLEEAAPRLVRELDKDYPLNFYAREVLFSQKARAEFVPPDKPFPWSANGGQ